MSRITVSDAQGLMEAYNAVYASQELTEEQIWEEVEAWVNALLEEGHDLSEYTWEDMYGAYIEQLDEQGGRLPGPQRRAAQQAATERRNVAAAQAPTLPTGRQRGAGFRYQAVAADKGRGGDAAYRAGGGDAAAKSGLTRQQIQQRGMTATRAASAAPAPKPATAKPAPSAAPRPGTKAAGPESIKPKTPNPLLAGGDIRRMQQASQMRQKGITVTSDQIKAAERTKPTPVAPRATGSKKPGSAFEQFDAYDVVLEYLLDNGHADTVDEAHYVMMEMDGETIADICEGRRTSLQALGRESQKRKEDKERGRPETKAETHGRLALGDFSPSASPEARARGGRERLKDRGKVPQKGGKDMFEQVLEHLISEGYAETEEAALEIMANMSEEWKQSIVEQSAIASRAAAVVDDQRRGSHGMAHDQKMTGDSIKKLNRYKGPRVTPGLPGA